MTDLSNPTLAITELNRKKIVIEGSIVEKKKLLETYNEQKKAVDVAIKEKEALIRQKQAEIQALERTEIPQIKLKTRDHDTHIRKVTGEISILQSELVANRNQFTQAETKLKQIAQQEGVKLKK